MAAFAPFSGVRTLRYSPCSSVGPALRRTLIDPGGDSVMQPGNALRPHCELDRPKIRRSKFGNRRRVSDVARVAALVALFVVGIAPTVAHAGDL